MYKGTIIENSLADKGVLKKFKIGRSWEYGDWVLHDIFLDEDQIPELATNIDNGPWYVHVWQPDGDNVKVIFKNKIFDIKHSDKSTWTDVIKYGKSIGIPEEQLDFPIS